MNGLFRGYTILGFSKLLVSWLITKLFFRPARLIRFPLFIRGRGAITWGEGFTTGVGVRIDALSQSRLNTKLIIIGSGVQINDYVHIGAIEKVVIGDDVLIASKVFISDHNHGQYHQAGSMSSPDVAPVDRLLSSSPVFIEDRVWIGEGVCIMPGVRVGKGSIIGAGAVVTHDIPDDSIAVGVPARVIKTYCRQLNEWVVVL